MKLLINGKSRKIMYNEKENMYYYKCKGGTVDASKYFLKGDKVGSLTEGSLKKQCRKMLVGGGDSSIIQILKNIIEYLLTKIQSHNENNKYDTTLATLKTAVNSLSGSSDNPSINTTQNDVRELEKNLTLDCDTKLELIKLIVCEAS